MSSEIDELRKRYGDRKAFEWFMRAEDKRYFKMAEREIERNRMQVTKLLEEKIKNTTVLIAVSTAVLIIMMFTFRFRLLMIENHHRY